MQASDAPQMAIDEIGGILQVSAAVGFAAIVPGARLIEYAKLPIG
jgi:hypothetical protein